MAEKAKIGFVDAHRYRPQTADGVTSCEYCDGSEADHKELFPEKNPKARIEFAKPHRFIRRKESRGDCDYCGESQDAHTKHFPDFNPPKDRGLEYEPAEGYARCFAKPEA